MHRCDSVWKLLGENKLSFWVIYGFYFVLSISATWPLQCHWEEYSWKRRVFRSLGDERLQISNLFHFKSVLAMRIENLVSASTSTILWPFWEISITKSRLYQKNFMRNLFSTYKFHPHKNEPSISVQKTRKSKLKAFCDSISTFISTY